MKRTAKHRSGEGGTGGREGGREEYVKPTERGRCTCRCIGSGGQTGIRAVAPAHLPHPLVAGRRITVPPLPPPVYPGPLFLVPLFFSPIGLPVPPAGRRCAVRGSDSRGCLCFRRIVLHHILRYRYRSIPAPRETSASLIAGGKTPGSLLSFPKEEISSYCSDNCILQIHWLSKHDWNN